MVALPILLLQGCFAEAEVKGPVKDYLNEKYGVTDFTIISAAQGWFETQSYDVDVEIQKPYKTITHLSLFESKEIDEGSSSDIFVDIMKGAYIKQFPKVMDVTESLIDKYKLLDWSPMNGNEVNQKFYYYLRMNLGEQQREKILKDFKKTQVLDMKKLIPTLKPEKSFQEFGVVNFIFYYNTYNQSGDIPNAQNLFEDLKNSGVLTEGLYQVSVQMIEVPEEGGYTWKKDERNTNVLFKVDKSGQYTNELFKVDEMGQYKVITP